MKSLLLAASLLATTASASEVVINLASHHIHSAFDFNENNYGLGYRTDNDIEVGFYRNSYYNTQFKDADGQKTGILEANGNGYSIYIKGAIFEKALSANTKLILDVGLTYYGDDGADPILPILQPIVVFNAAKNVNINVGYLPTFIETTSIDANGKSTTDKLYGLVTLSVGYTF